MPIHLLEKAEYATKKATKPSSRLILLYNCLVSHSVFKWDFHRLYGLLSKLDSLEYHFTVALDYEYAVLCYQVNKEEEGFRQFGKLRRGQRYQALQRESYEMWRDLNSDIKTVPPARVTSMRVISVDSYGGWAHVEDFKRNIPFSLVHPWKQTLEVKDIVPCCVRFYKSGARAVPVSFAEDK